MLTDDTKTTKESIEAFAKEHGIEVKSVFVPWSKSRSFKPDDKIANRNLNWKVTISYKGRDILTCDYSAGLAHCPCYKQGERWTISYAELIKFETETGKRARPLGGAGMVFGGKPILPDTASVLHSLALDADVLNYSMFEEWASNFGYSEDSREAEKIYKACLAYALALRNGLGEALLAQLAEAVSGY